MAHIKIDNLVIDKHLPRTLKYSYPLLFIHGAGGTSEYLKNYLLFFAKAGWPSYAINLRGHHPSDQEFALAQMTIEDYLEDVERVMRDLAIENCVLIGHSMGGLIAQKIAMNFKSVKALITISSAPPFGVTPEMHADLLDPGTIMKSIWEMMNLTPVATSAFMAEKTLLNNIDETEREEIFRMFVAESLMVGYQIAQGVFVDPAEIKCPKLVIGCKLDLMAPESMEQKMAEFLQADYISYDQFAHLPMLEAGWEQSASDISCWLQNNVKDLPSKQKG
ncbi:MAG: alpha/beta fold hydrolase [Smithellaceae bacterium]